MVGFGYLTLRPQYICTIDGVEQPCDSELICASNLPYREDTQDFNYVRNWIREMDLMCTNHWLSNLMMSAFFVSVSLAGFTLGSAPQKFGYRKTLRFVLCVNSTAQLIMLFVPIFWVRCLCFACLGGTHIKKSFIVGWLDGFLRLKDKGLVTSFMLAFE